MTFTFKLSRRLALIFAAAAGAAFVGCSIDEPASVPFVAPPQFAVGDTLFTDGFESGVLAWDDNFRPSAKQIVAAAARTGTRGLRVTFSSTANGGTLSKFVAPGDRVHVRFAVRFPSTWTGATGLMTLRAAPASNPWAAFGVWGSCPTGSTWAVTGVTTTAPNLDLRFNTAYIGMPTTAGQCPTVPGTSGPSLATYPAPVAVSKGAWHVVEIEAQLNTVGQADGWQRVWLDDVLTGEWTGLRFRTSSAVQWNAVTLDLPSSGVTQTQSLDIDDIVVQRQRFAAPPPAPPPAPVTLFTETFDNTSFASRAWYDFAGTPAVSTTEKRSGTGSLLVQLAAGAQTPPMKRMRRLFTATDRLYVSYWVKYSTNYVGSGKNYHPHEFNVLSNQDQDWDGLTFNYLNTYIEQVYQNGGVPRISIQDSRMIDGSRIGQNLTNVTEQRSLGGCNGNSDATGVTECYQQGSQWYNLKTWDAAAVAFMPSPGVDYKGNWNHVEVEFQLNSVVGGIGQKDGVLRYWLNGNLKLERTNVLFRTGANPNLKFRQFLISPYIGDGSPVTQQMWIDDLTVGTSRPGSTYPPLPPAPAPVASVTVTPSTASLQVGATTTFNAVLRDSAGNVLGGRLVTWSASPGTIATVVNGVVTAQSVGQATIAATSEGRTGVALLTVTAAQPGPVATVSVTPSSATLQAGSTTQLNAVLRDAAGAVLTGRAVTWSTSAPTVSTVVNGLVTGVAAGQATVTATSEGRSGNAAITVTAVTPVPPPGGGDPRPAFDLRFDAYASTAALQSAIQSGATPWLGQGSERERDKITKITGVSIPGRPDLTSAMRYTWGLAGRGSSQYTIRAILDPKDLPPGSERWVEVWARFSNGFVNAPPGGPDYDYKFLLFVTTQGPRWNVQMLGQNGGNTQWGYPNNEAAWTSSGNGTEGRLSGGPWESSEVWDGQWHRHRFHLSFGSGNAHSTWYVDNKPIHVSTNKTITGSFGEWFIGANMNFGPTQVQTLDWANIRIWTSNPGWGF